MVRFFNLSKLFLVLALLPASASAITITISAPSNSSTELTVTVTGEAMIDDFEGTAYFFNTGDYIDYGLGPDEEYFNLSSGITKHDSGPNETATRIFLDADSGSNDDDLYILFDGGLGAPPGMFTFSGSATIDLSSENHNFGQFNIGTYEDNGNTVIVQYSTVPDTGSTAALLGVGAAALAFARSSLG